MLTGIDSLEIYKRLKSAKVSDKAAKEIAEIFSDVVEQELATKRDLKELENKFLLKMEQVKNQMVIWYIGSFVAALAYLTALIRWAK